jgi:hypothetical protein
VRDGDDNDSDCFNAVDDAVRVSVQAANPVARIDSLKEVRILCDPRNFCREGGLKSHSRF